MLGPSQKAHVIIHPLEQPHRFDYALQCACGFQHHGFANPNSTKGDAIEDMREAAKSHLRNRHSVPVNKVGEHFIVLGEAHPGGLSHDMLKGGLDAGRFTIAKEAKPQVQPGGVKK
jgi:hypothetical protein